MNANCARTAAAGPAGLRRLLFPESWPATVRAGLVLAAATWVAFGPLWRAPWLDEDFDRMRAALAHPFADWPATNASLLLDHTWVGFDARVHQASNLGLHFLTALFIFAVLRFAVTRSSVAGAGWGFFPPLGGALLWLLHPLQVDTLAGTAGRGAMLAGMLLLLALWAFATGASRNLTCWKLLAVVAVALGTMAHGTMLAAPWLLLAFDRAFLASSWGEVWRQRGRWHGAIFAVMIAGLVVLLRSRGAEGVLAAGAEPWRAAAWSLPRFLWPHPLVYGQTPGVVPMIALTMAAALAAARLGRVGGLALVAVAAGLGVVSHTRTAIHASAVALWSDTLARDPTSPRARLELAQALAAAGRMDAALEHFEQAVQLAPRDATAHRQLAGMLAQAGRLGEAVAEYETSLKLEPDSAAAHLGLASLQFRLGRAAPAASHYEAATRLGVSPAERRREQGRVLAEAGRFDEALVELDAAAKFAPAEAETRLLRGMVLSAAGRPDEGMKEFVAAVRLDPDDGSAHAALGDALVEDHRPAEALSHYETALLLQPARSGPLHASMGGALILLGRAAEAMAAYEEALRANPDDEGARTSLERVRTAAERHGGKK